MWGFGGHSSGPTQGTSQRILLANPDYTQRYLELSRSRSGSAQQTPHTGRMNASPLTRSTANTQHTHHHHHTHHTHHATVVGTSAIPTSARQKLSSGHGEDTMAATHSAILSAPLSQTDSAMDFTNSHRWSPRRHAVPRSPWAVNAEPTSTTTTTTTTGMSSARPLCAPTTCPSLNLRTQHYAYPSASTSATQSVFASSMHVSSSANGTMPGSSGKSSEGTSSRSNVSHTVRIPRAATATATNNNKGSAAQTIVIARQGTSAASSRRQDPQRHNNDMNDNNDDDESVGKQHATYCHGSKNSSPCEVRGHALTIPTGADVATTTGGGTVTTGSTGPYFTMSSNNTTEATTMSSAASTHELSNCKVVTPRSHKDVMTTPGTTNTNTTTNTVSGAAATWPSSSFLQSSSPTFLTVGSGSVTGHEAETSHTAHPATTVQHEKQEEETTTRVANTGKAQELPSERYYHAPYSRVNSMTVTSGLTLAAVAPGRGAEVRCGKAAQMVRAVVSARGGFETTTTTNNTNSSAGLTSERTGAKTNATQSAGDGRYAAVPSSTTTSSTTIEALVSARYGRAAVVRPRNGGGPILYSPPTTNNMSTMEVRGRNGSALISPAPPPAPTTLYTTGSSSNSSGRRVGALRLRTSSAATRRSNNNMNSNGGAYDRRGGGEGGVGGEARNEVRSARSLQALAKSRDVLRRLVEQWNYVAEENKEAYKEGGYLAVTPGDVLHGRYIVVQKLGWGQFSTVWLCYDKLSGGAEGKNGSSSSAPPFVAIKIARCDRNAQHRATTVYEVRLLRYLSLLLPPACPVTSLLDSFEVNGAYGTHLCMVMPVHGSNLLCVVDAMKAAGLRRRSAQEVRLIKHILLAVLDGLEGLRAGYVLHTDIKPENILCTSPDPKTVSFMQAFCRRQSLQGKLNSGSCDEMMLAAMNGRGGGAWRELVCLADMGLSVVLEPPSVTGAAMTIAGQARTSLSHLVGQKKEFHVRRRGVVSNTNGVLIQTREYRAPEVLLGMDFTCETDVWSVGCVVYELITGQFLMDPKRKTRNARQMDIEHLAMMMQLIGPLPSEITELRQKFTAYYDGRDLSSIDLHAARTPPVYLHRYVDRDGNFIYANMYRHYERRQLYKELEPYLGSTDEAMEAASFILMCLYSYEPQYRPTAAELKAHSWLQDAAK